MLNQAFSQLMLRLLATVLGGFGVFCLFMSFVAPWVGAHAFILIAAATAIEYFSEA